MSVLGKLDSEHFGRIMEISNAWDRGKRLHYGDVFHSPTIVPSINKPKVILGTFDTTEIYANYPFTHRLYVIVCPYCIKPEDARLLREILTHSDIVPILIAKYTKYPEAVARTLIDFPHISRSEFYFFRNIKVLSFGTTHICPHCIQEEEKKLLEIIAKRNLPSEAANLASTCISNLEPFIDPDLKLVELLSDAVKNKDIAALKIIAGTSEALSKIRTYQAYQSRSILNSSQIPKLLRAATDVFPESEQNLGNHITQTIGASLDFSFAKDIKPKDFFPIVNEHRDSLSSMVDKMINASTKNGEIRFSKLQNQIAHLNAEIQSLRTNKRYLAYKAGFGFLRTNKLLVASTIAASALGLAGSLTGCGVSLVSGIGSNYGLQKLREANKLKPSQETEDFMSQVKASLRPHLHHLLSIYSGTSLSAIQISEISDVLKERSQKAR